MKRIYFVRHGQTNHNGQRIFQSDSEHLNEVGKQQASLVANRFANNIEVIIASPLLRAQETARIIASVSGCKIETLDTLKEMLNPAIIRGKSYDDPTAAEVYGKWLEKILDNKSYGQDDIENFFDLSLRAKGILNTLTARSEEKILVVAHSVVIKAVLTFVLTGNITSPEVMEHFQNHIKIQNTGVVSLIITEQNNKTMYKVLFE